MIDDHVERWMFASDIDEIGQEGASILDWTVFREAKATTTALEKSGQVYFLVAIGRG